MRRTSGTSGSRGTPYPGQFCFKEMFHLASSVVIIRTMVPSAGQKRKRRTDCIYSEKYQIFHSVNTLYV